MRMLFTGCTQCGRSTTSVEGLCSECELLRIGAPPQPRDRVIVLRRELKHRHHHS